MMTTTTTTGGRQSGDARFGVDAEGWNAASRRRRWGRRSVFSSRGDASRRGREWEEYQAGDDDWETARDDDDDDDDDDEDARGV